MRSDFRRRVREALADLTLQQALEGNARRRMEAWEETFASLPDVEAHRQRAREIREKTLRNLGGYLEVFTRRLESRGVRVHRAVDAAQACRLVVDIARAYDAELVAKSKSMLSEEIGLNWALESAGMRAVETDLGEFIVQLRGEQPAHIITPAVHLLREDVAETFARALDMPYCTDVEFMTAAARRSLREVFLSASVGVSGVNFGVAESGTLCVVTNEGNGRMVTTLPPVHIALMGVERLLPTLEDLALMLQLLPRSATGQKLTSYVTLIQGPRRRVDPDGPEARHLILVDNGRLALSKTDLAESLLCIRCGACLNVCPVFREIGGHAYASVYPGPIGSVVSPGLFGMAAYGHLAKASTLCGACREVCPVDIDLPTLLLRTRHAHAQAVSSGRVMRCVMRFYAWVMQAPWRYRLIKALAALGSRLLPRRQGWIRTLPPPLSAWTRSRHFPPFALRPFLARAAETRPARTDAEPPRMERTEESGKGKEPSHKKDRVARFQAELEALGGVVLRCSEEQAAAEIVHRLRSLGVHTLLAWETQGGLGASILRRLREEGFEFVQAGLPRGDGQGRRDRLAELERVEVGLTGAVAGLADTGTVVVPSGPGRSQLASLLPLAHLVVLRSGDIYASMADWLAAEGTQTIAETSSLALISGPSLTADIEMTLTIGVHGPERVIVFCLQD